MKNLTQEKRIRMMRFLESLRESNTDDENALKAINEIENALNEKKYGLVWEKHTEHVDEMLDTHLPVFEEVPERQIIANPDEDFNFLLEGDNLHSLKLLTKTHRGKVDVIYIDPPYNTGNKDFVYNDSFVEQADGYLHSKWLSFMAERLRLAKDLLKNDGVMFISIDDNEQAQLKLLCQEIFSEKNVLATIPWRKRTAKSDVPCGVSQDFEWILVVAKSDAFRASAETKSNRKYHVTPDFPGRPWRLHDLTTQRSSIERPNSYFTMVDPKTGKEYPAQKNRTWAVTKDTFEQYYSEGKIVFPDDYDFIKIKRPAMRYWKEDDVAKAGDLFGRGPMSTLLPENIGRSEDGTKELSIIFDNVKKFSYPKPVSLIKYLIECSTYLSKNNAPIVLDFFAGSGTTAHAVNLLNAEDNGNRRFVLCTNNENNLCTEVTFERLKRIQKELPHNLKYFRTNFIERNNDLENRLYDFITPLIELEHMTSLNGKTCAYVYSEDELSEAIERLDNGANLFIPDYVFIDENLQDLIDKKEIIVITVPQYYFEAEIRSIYSLESQLDETK